MSIEIVNYQKAPSAKDIVDSLTAGGAGLHQDLMRVVGKLAFAHKHDDHEILDLLLQKVIDGCRSEGQARSEILKTIAKVRQTSAVTGATSKADKWPEPDLDQIGAIVNQELTAIRGNDPLDYLRQLSPVKGATAQEIIDVLFPGNPLLCVGEAPSKFETKRKTAHGDFASFSYIVPSPMSALKGLTQEGRYSDRSLNNAGPRRFLPIEFDIAEFCRDKVTPTVFAPLVREWRSKGISAKQAQAAIILYLMRNREPVLIVDSGGKSLHVWFYVKGTDEERITATMKHMVRIGADRVTHSRAQFVRMPSGTRWNDGKPQPTIYFNPNGLIL
jgi:hypothetical protein